jgi:integrase
MICQRKNRNISVKFTVPHKGKNHVVEISTGTKDLALAKERAPALMQEARDRITKPQADCTIPELEKLYYHCDTIKANLATRKRNWSDLIDILEWAGIDTEGNIDRFALVKGGKSFIRRYEDEVGDLNKLRKASSVISKNFLYYLEYEKGIPVSCFSHMMAYSPKQPVVKPFRVSEEKVQSIYEKGKALRETHPEYFKIFLLASSGGLRRSEILRLTWGDIYSINGRHFIVLKQTKANKEQQVNIPESTYGALMEMKNGHRDSQPVIESTNSEKLIDREFIPFLREHMGIDSDKPLHYLRKCLGAMLASKHGIYVASKTLRHASVSTTEKFYADLVAPANDIEIL